MPDTTARKRLARRLQAATGLGYQTALDQIGQTPTPQQMVVAAEMVAVAEQAIVGVGGAVTASSLSPTAPGRPDGLLLAINGRRYSRLDVTADRDDGTVQMRWRSAAPVTFPGAGIPVGRAAEGDVLVRQAPVRVHQLLVDEVRTELFAAVRQLVASFAANSDVGTVTAPQQIRIFRTRSAEIADTAPADLTVSRPYCPDLSDQNPLLAVCGRLTDREAFVIASRGHLGAEVEDILDWALNTDWRPDLTEPAYESGSLNDVTGVHGRDLVAAAVIAVALANPLNRMADHRPSRRPVRADAVTELLSRPPRPDLP